MSNPKLFETGGKGALWGAGIFLCLWLGMLGTIGELLLLLPALSILVFLGVEGPGTFILWRGVATVISAAAFAFIGVRTGPFVFSSWARLSKPIRKISIGVIVTVFLLIILVGRSLRMH